MVGAAWALFARSESAPASSAPPASAVPSTTTSPAGAAAALGGLVPSLEPTAARALLAQLPLTTATAVPGYDRDAFGEAWSDVDGNGCNQRDDVLLRDAVAETVEVGTQGSCAHDVLAGTWLDPYTGALVEYDDLKNVQQAQAIPIDHIVPLSEAYRSGASDWDEARRVAFANSVDNLVAASEAANSSKGDQDPATWRPPVAVWCAYATVWVDVKDRWTLAVDTAERTALADMLDTC